MKIIFTSIWLGLCLAWRSGGAPATNLAPLSPGLPSAVVDVWPVGKMPGHGADAPESEMPPKPDHAHRITNISQPTLSLFPVPGENGAVPAMIVCPGGGYHYVVYDKEGTEIAVWLNSLGIDALILKYRVPQNRDGAFQDVQRALSLVRAHAAEWNIDPKRLGIIGFSAGGNLAAKASTRFGQRTYPAIDLVDQQSCRPDFAILVYPAYLADPQGHVSPDLNLKANIPPTLIIHNEDDKTFVPGSKLYHAALDAAKAPNKLIVYRTGGHGYGLRSTQDVRVWPQAAAGWLRDTHILSPVAAPGQGESITNFGAVGDGTTLNTRSIQSAIDHLAGLGGGTLTIPAGVFVSGAIFLQPGVNVYLDSGAVLKGSTNILDYPERKTRIEGQSVDWIPALVNARDCDHLCISGSGTLDGNGPAFYARFWNARRHDSKVTNLDVRRPRLVFIEDSTGVQIQGVHFRNSAFWNLHLYHCQDATVGNASFEAPFGRRPDSGPSTDGVDIDSCQRVTVRDCFFAVNDDCICLKGTKGPFALEDSNSPPTEHICVTNCTFKAGQGVVTFGSEGTVIRGVVVERCRVTGKIPLVRLKLRPDTPQDYEDIYYHDITLAGDENVYKDEIFDVGPWTQFYDLKGQPKPKSIVKNVTLSDIKGSFGSFGEILGNLGQSEISGITLENIDLHLRDDRFNAANVRGLKLKNVTINGKPFSLNFPDRVLQSNSIK